MNSKVTGSGDADAVQKTSLQFGSFDVILLKILPEASLDARVQDGEQERRMAVIKQTCTAIHPSVEWRFQEMAKNYLEKQSKGEIPTPEPVVFNQVIPGKATCTRGPLGVRPLTEAGVERDRLVHGWGRPRGEGGARTRG